MEQVIQLKCLLVIPTERSEWRNLFKDVSTTLDMTCETDISLPKKEQYTSFH